MYRNFYCEGVQLGKVRHPKLSYEYNLEKQFSDDCVGCLAVSFSPPCQHIVWVPIVGNPIFVKIKKEEFINEVGSAMLEKDTFAPRSIEYFTEFLMDVEL